MVKFNPQTDIPTLTNRIILITGGTDGLGKESLTRLSLNSPTKIYLAARSQEKATQAIKDLTTTHPDATNVTFLPLDLSDFTSIKRAAKTFLDHESRLDILLCNAGIMGARGVTEQGYEIAFGVNHVGHALLMKLLFPIMRRTAKENPGSDPRIVVLGSDAEKFAPRNYYLLNEVKGDLGSYAAFTRYGHSKVANAQYVAAFARRFPETETGVKVVCVHPGAVMTNLGHDVLGGWPIVGKVIRQVARVVIGLVPVEVGVANQLWACIGDGVEHGVFYHPVGLKGKGTSRIGDESKEEELWVWTEKELDGHD